MESLGQLARNISDDQRRDIQLQADDKFTREKLSKIRQAKEDLRQKIVDAATKGDRRVVALDIDESGIQTRDDIPEELSCPHYQEFWDFLVGQDLAPKLGATKVGYGVYHYYILATW